MLHQIFCYIRSTDLNRSFFFIPKRIRKIRSCGNGGQSFAGAAQLAFAVAQLSFEVGVGSQLMLHIIKEGLHSIQGLYVFVEEHRGVSVWL